MSILIAILFVGWVYLLTVLHRAKLPFFKFFVGSVGIFLFMMILIQPIITVPLENVVASTTGLIGKATKMYYAYPQYSLIFIENSKESISMYIDYECSGVIEIMAFLSLLWFFPVYNSIEKLVVSLIGAVWVFFSNVTRLFLICVIIYFGGNDTYFFAHAIFGRIIFYCMTILLYYMVFTKSQIVRQKVGKFNYADND